MKASDLISQRPTLHVAVYGPSGVGKTSWGARAPQPLIILTEPQGLASIMAAAPDAEVVRVDTLADARAVLLALTRGQPQADGTLRVQLPDLGGGQPACEVVCGSVVIDSVTDLQKLLADEVVREMAKNTPEEIRRLSRADLQMQHYAPLKARTERLLDTVRRLPVSTVSLYLLDERVDESDGAQRTVVRPALIGGARDSVAQYYSLIGRAHTYTARSADGSPVHQHRVSLREASDRALTKTMRGLPPYIVHDLDMPGSGTLGSILLALYPGAAAQIPHNEADSASHIMEPR